MSKPKLHHFPLFFGDLLAATPRWKGPQRSLYVLLLAYQWFDGPIPTAPKDIAEMCGYPLDEFERLWQVVGKKFVECDGGLINLRCEEHREKASKISKKRSTAGKKGGDRNRDRLKQTDKQTGKQNDRQIDKQTGEAKEGAFATPFAEPSNPIQSNPILSNPIEPEARFARKSIPAPGNSDDEDWARLQHERKAGWNACVACYPKFLGRSDWLQAENAAGVLVDTGQTTWPRLRELTQLYADYCVDTERPVMRPEHFFTTAPNPPCLQVWEAPEKLSKAAKRTKSNVDAMADAERLLFGSSGESSK